MHLLAARSTGVAHITPQVDPVPGGPTGEGARGGTQPGQRPGTHGRAGAGQGPSRVGRGGPGGGRRAHVRPYVTIAAVGARPVPADRGWFELVRCHSDAAAL